VLSGRHSVLRALEVLNNEWGYRTRPSKQRGGGPLSASAAYKILHSVFYTGHFISRGITHVGKHPAMVTDEEFARVQEILSRKTKARQTKHSFAYSGLMRCKNCDRQIIGSQFGNKATGGPRVYYHCSSAKRICDRRGIPEQELEGKIERLLTQIAIDPEAEQIGLAALGKWQQRQPATAQYIRRDQQSTLNELKKQQYGLLDLKLRGVVDEQLFVEKQQVLNQEIKQLEEQFSNSDEALGKSEHSARNTLRFLAHARSRFLIGTALEKREIAQALGISYSFDRGYVEIELHPTLYSYRRLKPLDIGSQSQEDAHGSSSFYVGEPAEALSEQFYSFFREQPSFPALACLS